MLSGYELFSDKYDGQTHYCDISLFTFHVLYSQNFHIATIFFLIEKCSHFRYIKKVDRNYIANKGQNPEER